MIQFIPVKLNNIECHFKLIKHNNMKLNLLLLIVIFSCSNNNQDKLNNKDSLEISNSLEFNQTQLKILNFEEYWKVFGTALKANDTNKIKLLVETPLVILGHEDHDPHLKINANEIVKYVLFAVDNGGYYDMEKDTSIEAVQKEQLFLYNIMQLNDQ